MYRIESRFAAMWFDSFPGVLRRQEKQHFSNRSRQRLRGSTFLTLPSGLSQWRPSATCPLVLHQDYVSFLEIRPFSFILEEFCSPAPRPPRRRGWSWSQDKEVHLDPKTQERGVLH